jgi:dTDP-4-amino-4,6-dideoxygalactose transaminase
MKKIPFYRPYVSGNELMYLEDVLKNPDYLLLKTYLKRCTEYLQQKLQSQVLLTNSCTSALEIICKAEEFGDGDEIIMPSYTYVSTANAFAKFGATPVFVDISLDGLNINVDLIEDAITPRTRAIVVVHCSGIACDMDALNYLCNKHNLLLIEDAAQAFDSYYKNQSLGTIGDYGTFSFDHNKNVHSGQGGALVVKNKSKLNTIIRIYENGTNRSSFVQGEVPYFEWVCFGSKYFLSDINAAFLLAQLELSERVLYRKKALWQYYFDKLQKEDLENISLPQIPNYANHNGNTFYIILKNESERNSLKQYLLQQQIESSFHFIPLHSSVMGKKVGRFSGNDIFTTQLSGRVLRLPLYMNLKFDEIDIVVKTISRFFKQ